MARKHTLQHAIYGWKCDCSAAEIYDSGCIICGKFLTNSTYSDVCGKRCFKKLCEAIRRAPPTEAEYQAAIANRTA